MKTSKRNLLPLLCLFICIVTNIAQAQVVGEEVVIYGKDKSIYRGELLSENDAEIELVLQTNDTITIGWKKIRRVRYEEQNIFYNKGESHIKDGYFWGLSAGLGLANSISKTGTGELELMFGKRINKRFSLAMILGLSAVNFEIDNSFADQEYLTFSAHGKYYLNDRRIRPFLFSQVGYAFGPSDAVNSVELNTGIKIENGIGFHFASKRRHRTIISLAHNLQHLKGRQTIWDFNEPFDPFNPFGSSEIRSFDLWMSVPILKIGFELF